MEEDNEDEAVEEDDEDDEDEDEEDDESGLVNSPSQAGSSSRWRRTMKINSVAS